MSNIFDKFLGLENLRWPIPPGEPLSEGAGCPEREQLLHTPQAQDDRWIFRGKNVTYQKPPFWVR
jgi:hypothetical protein